MRPTFALPALVLAPSPDRRASADDVTRPPSASQPACRPGPARAPQPVPQAEGPRSRRALLGRPRPRRPSAPDDRPRRPTRPGPCRSDPPVAARPVPLQAIPTAPKPQATEPPADAPLRRTQATAADLGMPIGPGTDSTAPAARRPVALAPAGPHRRPHQQPRPRHAPPGEPGAGLGRGRRGRPALPGRPQPDRLHRLSADHPDPQRHLRHRRGPGRDRHRRATAHSGSFYHYGQDYFLIALRQPVEFGHQTTHRHSIAKAAYKQVQWQIVQAELTALVQTYRFFQTAAYRREKLRVAEQLATSTRTCSRRSNGA